MRARVESFERLADGGMVAHLAWIDDAGEIVLLDHVRLPEWDDLADDPQAQAQHLMEQIKLRRQEVERREALRRRTQERLAPVASAFAGVEVVVDPDGTAYVEITERKRMEVDEYVRSVQTQRRRTPPPA